MVSFIKIAVACSIMIVATLAIAPALALRTSGNLKNIGSLTNLSNLIAYSVVDDAYSTCVNELARYGVTVTELLDSYSGKGGATVILAGYNSGGYPVTVECNLSVPSRELTIEYR
jgi:hypothetical protein